MRSITSSVALASTIVIAHAADSKYTCMPNDACWPSVEQWTTFNESIGGALKITHPWAEPVSLLILTGILDLKANSRLTVLRRSHKRVMFGRS